MICFIQSVQSILKSNSCHYSLLLRIINDARVVLEQYMTFAGKTRLENCVFHALNIIEYSLSQQDRFFEAHQEAKSSIRLMGLNK